MTDVAAAVVSGVLLGIGVYVLIDLWRRTKR